MLGKPAFTSKLVAKNLGLDQAKVSSVTDFFYKELDKELKSCQHPFVYVKGLGTFAMNPKAVEKMIRCLLRKKPHINSNEGTEGRRRDNLFELFRIRRLIKTQLKENKKLKDATKIVDGNKRKHLSSSGN